MTVHEKVWKAVEDIERGLDSRTIMALFLENLGEWFGDLAQKIENIEESDYDAQRMKDLIVWLKNEIGDTDA